MLVCEHAETEHQDELHWKGDSFWGKPAAKFSSGAGFSSKVILCEQVPGARSARQSWPSRRGRNPHKTQQWRGFQRHGEKSLARCRPERAGGKVRLCEQPGRLLAPYGDNF